MWPRSRKKLHLPTPEQVEEQLADSDVNEARQLRVEATGELRRLDAQAPTVNRLAQLLIERRKFNHFGEELAVTYTPRRI